MIIIALLFLSFINAGQIQDGQDLNNWPVEVVRIANSIIRPINRERMSIELNLTNRLFPEYEDLYIPNYDLDFNYYFTEFLTDNAINLDSLISNKTLGSQLINQDYQLSKFYKRYGYRYLFRIKIGTSLKNILNRSKKCYNINKCSKTQYTEFRSCINKIPGCDNAHLFYGKILIESLTRLTYIDSQNFRYIYGRVRSDFKYDFPFGQ